MKKFFPALSIPFCLLCVGLVVVLSINNSKANDEYDELLYATSEEKAAYIEAMEEIANMDDLNLLWNQTEKSMQTEAMEEFSSMDVLISSQSPVQVKENQYQAIRTQSDQLATINSKLEALNPDGSINSDSMVTAISNKTWDITNAYASFFSEHGWDRYGDDPNYYAPMYTDMNALIRDVEEGISNINGFIENIENGIWEPDISIGETKEELLHEFTTKKEIKTKFLQKLKSQSEPCDMKALSGEFMYLYSLPGNKEKLDFN